MKNPVAQTFPSRCDSLRRHLRHSITMKVRISPPWEKSGEDDFGEIEIEELHRRRQLLDRAFTVAAPPDAVAGQADSPQRPE